MMDVLKDHIYTCKGGSNTTYCSRTSLLKTALEHILYSHSYNVKAKSDHCSLNYEFWIVFIYLARYTLSITFRICDSSLYKSSFSQHVYIASTVNRKTVIRSITQCLVIICISKGNLITRDEKQGMKMSEYTRKTRFHIFTFYKELFALK